MRYVKDNRLLPRGFDKRTPDPEIAVHGGRRRRGFHAGGPDPVPVAMGAAQGPSSRSELWHQPIAIAGPDLKPYDAAEPKRFVSYYEAWLPAPASCHGACLSDPVGEACPSVAAPGTTAVIQ